ncbi:tRNA uridine-5-carboxymethylaminomethyl(34) synthesis GTPase MnmE [Candidatus Dependentiae bacterium]|nr:tRNA uridine-5-carboxymethylaminomethyl(34) synthesis GTPase MnmE [Candidatus Dependentiae bacterium]
MNKNQFLVSFQEQVIVAQCTPQGAGAIALLRLSGNDVFNVVDKAARLASGKRLIDQNSHSIHFGSVINQRGQSIDQVLFLVMKGPRTFTGQDTVEITCHNNQFIVEEIMNTMIICGARIAGKGEFTQRAVTLGKLDLIQAEAIHDLIHAQTAASLKYSLQQLEGSLSSWVFEIENSVLEMIAFCEGSFEFLDEEMEFGADILKKMEQLLNKINKLLATFSKQQYIKEGIKIVLMGSVNVGKSSLFNCLLEKNRAIVTPVAGTTRDTIEAGVYKEGEFLTFIDTAGIRETEDEIERAGIDRSFQEASVADIILLVVDRSQKISIDIVAAYEKIMQNYSDKIILVYNKMEEEILFEEIKFDERSIFVSAKNNQNIDLLYQEIFKKIKQLKGSDAITCLLNKRQYDLLFKFYRDLEEVLPMLTIRRIDYELVSYRLKESLSLMAELTGKTISQAAFDKIFDTFCVGK